MKDTREIADADYAKQYADWHIKTGGFARDMTLRDYYAGLAMQGILAQPVSDSYSGWDCIPVDAYKVADAMLKERAK